jgi:hypothetical protein
MGRTLREVLAALPLDEQKAIEARFQELSQEVESLRQLRQVAGKVQADVAAALHIKQPSVSRIEKQTDMYLSTLRGYVEAIGGELELIVRLPSRPPLRLRELGEVFSTPTE